VKESKPDRKRLKEKFYSATLILEKAPHGKGNFETLYKLAKDGDTDHHLIN